MPAEPRRTWLQRALAGLAAASIVVSLLPLIGSVWWGFDLLSHFRLQYLAAQAVLLLVLASRRRVTWAGLIAACMVVNALPLVPYLASARPVGEGPMVKVLTSNVRGDVGDPVKLLEEIQQEDPDLVLVIELRPEFAAKLQSLHARYPYRLLRPRPGYFGIGLYSRYPLRAHEHAMIGPNVAVEARVETTAGPLSLLGVHLLPPTSGEWTDFRDRQLEAIAADTAVRHGPLLVCGDFNITPYSPTYRKFLADGDLLDARFGQGLGLSWPTGLPILGIPIDHCFLRGPIGASAVRRLHDIGSDHYPQIFEFVMSPHT